ncbi:hypothetical protein C1645_837670, partial [Glomus cerebriforme]
MKYKKAFINILIALNFVSLVYGNNKPQCIKCLGNCCEDFKNQQLSQDKLFDCTNDCKLEHCDGVEINYKDYICEVPPPKICFECLEDCCKTNDFDGCKTECKFELGDCKDVDFDRTDFKNIEDKCKPITIIQQTKICTKCLEKCCITNEFNECKTECEDCKGLNFNNAVFKDIENNCKPIPIKQQTKICIGCLENCCITNNFNECKTECKFILGDCRGINFNQGGFKDIEDKCKSNNPEPPKKICDECLEECCKTNEFDDCKFECKFKLGNCK